MAGDKLPVEIGFLLFLTILNIRGVRESVLALTPIFLVFLVTHAVLIGGGIIGHSGDTGAVVTEVQRGYQQGVSLLGVGGLRPWHSFPGRRAGRRRPSWRCAAGCCR